MLIRWGVFWEVTVVLLSAIMAEWDQAASRGTLPFVPGGGGVDLFFVISGFIMVYASADLFAKPQARWTFWTRRIIRIVPLYWLITIALAASQRASGRMPPKSEVMQSMFFIPYDGIYSPYIAPLLGQGWTLNYEMWFYWWFGCFILLSSRRAVLMVSITIMLLIAIGLQLTPDSTVSYFWTRPIMLEFVAGMTIAATGCHRRVAPFRWRIMVAFTAGILLLLPLHAQDEWFGWPRTLTWGVAATLLVLSAVTGPVRLPWPRAWQWGGEISYALYLIHVPVIMIVRWLTASLYLPTSRPLFVAVSLMLSLMAAAMLNRWIEQPIAAGLKKWLRRFGGRYAQAT